MDTTVPYGVVKNVKVVFVVMGQTRRRFLCQSQTEEVLVETLAVVISKMGGRFVNGVVEDDCLCPYVAGVGDRQL